ncbi:MAG TPA: hypothetical protein PK520_03170 [Exilispira sp.]|jgi:hypothetical protein|nr:hypothetical protein [Spirochaetota bacterium]NLJ05010.1 hypothetical protein [Exilispira sp.]HPB48652.1 hypothetical protein [Exilispira sp.]HQJ41044.1 hypothetical protein [Exilispira sp.]HQM88733.1 hypothetical protein [Exilispira sp.]
MKNDLVLLILPGALLLIVLIALSFHDNDSIKTRIRKIFDGRAIRSKV